MSSEMRGEIACEIVRNVCESDPADPDAPMTVCIDVTRLREIVDNALLARGEAGADGDKGPWRWKRTGSKVAPAGGDVAACARKLLAEVMHADALGDLPDQVHGSTMFALAQALDSAPAGSGEVEDWMVELFDEVYEREWNRAADEADDRHKAIIGPADRHATREAIAALLRKLQQGADYVMVQKADAVRLAEFGQSHASCSCPTSYVKLSARRVLACVAASQGQEGGANE